MSSFKVRLDGISALNHLQHWKVGVGVAGQPDGDPDNKDDDVKGSKGYLITTGCIWGLISMTVINKKWEYLNTVFKYSIIWTANGL